VIRPGFFSITAGWLFQKKMFGHDEKIVNILYLRLTPWRRIKNQN